MKTEHNKGKPHNKSTHTLHNTHAHTHIYMHTSMPTVSSHSCDWNFVLRIRFMLKYSFISVLSVIVKSYLTFKYIK